MALQGISHILLQAVPRDKYDSGYGTGRPNFEALRISSHTYPCQATMIDGTTSLPDMLFCPERHILLDTWPGPSNQQQPSADITNSIALLSVARPVR